MGYEHLDYTGHCVMIYLVEGERNKVNIWSRKSTSDSPRLEKHFGDLDNVSRSFYLHPISGDCSAAASVTGTWACWSTRPRITCRQSQLFHLSHYKIHTTTLTVTARHLQYDAVTYYPTYRQRPLTPTNDTSCTKYNLELQAYRKK